MLIVPNAYRFTNKTHTDECYADISHYLQKNLLFSIILHTTNCVEAYLGCSNFLCPPFLDNVPNLLLQECLNICPQGDEIREGAYHRTAELSTCHRRRKTVIAD